MANIPVEKERSKPWWLWLLGAILLIGLIWLIAELFDDDAEEPYVAEDTVTVVDPVTPVTPVAPAETGAITSIAELADGRAAIGREVRLEDVRVITLTGDSSYFVGSGTNGDEGALVVLENLGESETYAAGPDGSDGRYNINAGEVIDVYGVVAAFDESVPDYADMPGADRDRAMRSGVYINANRVEAAGDDTEVLTPGAMQPETL